MVLPRHPHPHQLATAALPFVPVACEIQYPQFSFALGPPSLKLELLTGNGMLNRLWVAGERSTAALNVLGCSYRIHSKRFLRTNVSQLFNEFLWIVIPM
jgi:hypothetical protein